MEDMKVVHRKDVIVLYIKDMIVDDMIVYRKDVIVVYIEDVIVVLRKYALATMKVYMVEAYKKDILHVHMKDMIDRNL